MKELLTTLLCMAVLSTSAQYNEKEDFKQAFKQHMLTPTTVQKPALTFEQRDIVHHHVAGGVLLAAATPVIIASAITFAKGGENTNLAGTGLAFGSIAFGGSIYLHTLGFLKLKRYEGRKKELITD